MISLSRILGRAKIQIAVTTERPVFVSYFLSASCNDILLNPSSSRKTFSHGIDSVLVEAEIGGRTGNRFLESQSTPITPAKMAASRVV